MDEDAEVLRFRPRSGWGGGQEHDDDRGVPGPRHGAHEGYRGYGRGGLGELTKVVLMANHVVDVVREPVDGSGYEVVALELEARGLLRPPDPPPPPEPPAPPPHERQLAWLARIVGGAAALDALDLEPLPPLDLCLDGIRGDLHDRVRGIDERLERSAPTLLGEEGLAAGRRLLTRAVASEPALLTRSDRDDVAAGAVLWAVAKGNDLVGTNRPVRATVIQDVCGLRSSPSGRGGSFAHAAGGDGTTSYGWPMWTYNLQPTVIPLGSPDVLLSRFRRRVALLRDLALQLRARTPVP